jgi:hypothetical protein
MNPKLIACLTLWAGLPAAFAAEDAAGNQVAVHRITGAAPKFDTAREREAYEVTPIPFPDGQVIEVAGIEILPNERLALCTRRGEVWLVDGAFAEDVSKVRYHRFATGLHEPLSLYAQDDWIYVTERAGITRLRDNDGDDRADVAEVVSAQWGLSGDFHEYAFSSRPDREGNVWSVLCLTGSVYSKAPWRGWAVRTTPDGRMIPTASGIRSPGGVGLNDAGDAFYTDNQGFWNGSSALRHLKIGSFQGAAPSLESWPLTHGALGPKPPMPSSDRILKERAKNPALLPPAVIFPHNRLGHSPTGLDFDPTGMRFGPFGQQLFVGEETFSQVQRVFLEKVNGVYQGAVFPFLSGLQSGIIGVRFAPDGTMFTGGTDRGWGSRGGKPFSLERVRWKGKAPFEIESIRVQPDGFDVDFTQPFDAKTAQDVKSFSAEAWTYLYAPDYGSEELEKVTPQITRAEAWPEQRRVKLTLTPVTKGHVHELRFDGLRSAKGEPLVHPVAWYTVNELPGEAAAQPAVTAALVTAPAAPKIYKRADMLRPRPTVVTPPTESTDATPGQPPSDAIVLFSGQDLAKWMEFNPHGEDDPSKASKWIVREGYAEAFGNQIQTRDKFADCHLHLEWASPAEVVGDGQKRGNSGLEFGDHGEIQILDSYQNDTYPDGQAAAIYGEYPPLVNASRKPGEWQSYDIFYFAPKFADGKKVQSATYTILHNGLPVHHAAEVRGDEVECRVRLRPHGGKVHFRNLWIRPMHHYDEHEGQPLPVGAVTKKQ